MVYRTAPYLMTLNDTYPQYQGHAILWCWISHKRYDIKIYSINEINLLIVLKLHTPYSPLSFPITLSDLAKYSMTRSVARYLCDSWASRFLFICHLRGMYYTRLQLWWATAVLAAPPASRDLIKDVSPCVCHDGSLVVERTVQLLVRVTTRTTVCCCKEVLLLLYTVVLDVTRTNFHTDLTWSYRSNGMNISHW